ncbi:MAG: hypothetical protein IKT65_02460, partial [Clostridia bacterium]|nr:hypothetical protein [Clostridia bacterium]
EEFDWEFLFIGANIDAVQTAESYGIERNRAVNYNADGEGTRVLYRSVAKAVSNMRSRHKLQENWCEEINADYERRRK